MRRFVVGDIHGAHLALLQVLERCGFDRTEDLLIVLGDICDGWPHVKECLDILMDIPNKVIVLGNHDEWAWNWLAGGIVEPEWWLQGGKATFKSFFPDATEVSPWIAVHMRPDRKYITFFNQAVLCHIIDDEHSPDTVFVHGGISRLARAEVQPAGFELTWDRQLWYSAVDEETETLSGKTPKNITKHKRIFVGHTAQRLEERGLLRHPAKRCEVWNMDTGAGWCGNLSIMDIDTEEYWMSDPVSILYPKNYHDN